MKSSGGGALLHITGDKRRLGLAGGVPPRVNGTMTGGGSGRDPTPVGVLLRGVGTLALPTPMAQGEGVLKGETELARFP